ncbi:hypothetical protein SAMN04488503_2017 [Humidesulfovibrio mexicanus]|uniref:Uncharacterized protein n=1 Tax=Humidesulfovibrio mexicanus TaxID=147047 RepID=A0A239AIX6_9BACT|nr:hypothetical protein [Humidesulfovibrio mexicanus]SNR95595.1 hypothetical protein SAMN04488503_2017 [Humidesulfovibrio mexicanus]
MILEAMAVGAVVGLNIAASRRYPWIGALWLFTILALALIFFAEIMHSLVAGESAMKLFAFGMLAIAPYPVINETHKAVKEYAVTVAGMKYIYATYAAVVVSALWSIGRIVQIVTG